MFVMFKLKSTGMGLHEVCMSSIAQLTVTKNITVFMKYHIIRNVKAFSIIHWLNITIERLGLSFSLFTQYLQMRFLGVILPYSSLCDFFHCLPLLVFWNHTSVIIVAFEFQLLV
jgi:hypothetical protein